MAVATLGGFPCLASSPVQWALKSGIQPYITTVDLAPQHAKELLAATQQAGLPTRLILGVDTTTPLVIEDVWVLHNAPAENYNLSRVTIADRRWMWSYSLVVGRYNIRRRSGVNRITVNDQPANDVVADALQYSKWSLRNGVAKWQAEEVLKDVLTKAESVRLGQARGYALAPALGEKLKNLPIDDVETNEAGDAALMRALSYLPEADVYIDYDGTAIFYSKASDGDRALVEKLGAEIVGRGHVEVVDFSLLRPRRIEVYFTRECELRFDFNEAAGGTTTEDARYIDNVLPQPDYSLVVGSKTYPAGTWHSLPALMDAWGVLPNPFGGASLPLSQSIIRKAMVPFMDLWAAIGAVGQFDPSADWIGRINAVQHHWRQTFRINERWVDRCLVFKPYRVATVDQVSGSRAPAMAFSDYCLLTTTRAQWKERSKGLVYAINQTGYPSTGNLDSTSRPSPAVVSVPDSDQGIVHLEYISDPLRLYEMTLPSKMDTGNLPRGDITQVSHSITFDSINSPGASLPSMAADFKCAVLLTAVPAAPNNLSQFHRLVVDPAMVASMVPGGGIGPCNGPVMQIYIGSGVETARVQWLDGRSADIEACFGVGQGANEAPPQPNLAGLVINEGVPGKAGGVSGGASLWSIAMAAAARIYASLKDRGLGSMAGMIQPLRPDGWASDVTHEVDSQGVVTTHLHLPDKVPQFSLMSFLDSDARAKILRLLP